MGQTSSTTTPSQAYVNKTHTLISLQNIVLQSASPLAPAHTANSIDIEAVGGNVGPKGQGKQLRSLQLPLLSCFFSPQDQILIWWIYKVLTHHHHIPPSFNNNGNVNLSKNEQKETDCDFLNLNLTSLPKISHPIRPPFELDTSVPKISPKSSQKQSIDDVLLSNDIFLQKVEVLRKLITIYQNTPNHTQEQIINKMTSLFDQNNIEIAIKLPQPLVKPMYYEEIVDPQNQPLFPHTQNTSTTSQDPFKSDSITSPSNLPSNAMTIRGPGQSHRGIIELQGIKFEASATGILTSLFRQHPTYSHIPILSSLISSRSTLEQLLYDISIGNGVGNHNNNNNNNNQNGPNNQNNQNNQPQQLFNSCGVFDIYPPQYTSIYQIHSQPQSGNNTPNGNHGVGVNGTSKSTQSPQNGQNGQNGQKSNNFPNSEKKSSLSNNQSHLPQNASSISFRNKSTSTTRIHPVSSPYPTFWGHPNALRYVPRDSLLKFSSLGQPDDRFIVLFHPPPFISNIYIPVLMLISKIVPPLQTTLNRLQLSLHSQVNRNDQQQSIHQQINTTNSQNNIQNSQNNIQNSHNNTQNSPTNLNPSQSHTVLDVSSDTSSTTDPHQFASIMYCCYTNLLACCVLLLTRTQHEQAKLLGPLNNTSNILQIPPSPQSNALNTSVLNRSNNIQQQMIQQQQQHGLLRSFPYLFQFGKYLKSSKSVSLSTVKLFPDGVENDVEDFEDGIKRQGDEKLQNGNQEEPQQSSQQSPQPQQQQQSPQQQQQQQQQQQSPQPQQPPPQQQTTHPSQSPIPSSTVDSISPAVPPNSLSGMDPYEGSLGCITTSGSQLVTDVKSPQKVIQNLSQNLHQKVIQNLPQNLSQNQTPQSQHQPLDRSLSPPSHQQQLDQSLLPPSQSTHQQINQQSSIPPTNDYNGWYNHVYKYYQQNNAGCEGIGVHFDKKENFFALFSPWIDGSSLNTTPNNAETTHHGSIDEFTRFFYQYFIKKEREWQEEHVSDKKGEKNGRKNKKNENNHEKTQSQKTTSTTRPSYVILIGDIIKAIPVATRLYSLQTVVPLLSTDKLKKITNDEMEKKLRKEEEDAKNGKNGKNNLTDQKNLNQQNQSTPQSIKQTPTDLLADHIWSRVLSSSKRFSVSADDEKSTDDCKENENNNNNNNNNSKNEKNNNSKKDEKNIEKSADNTPMTPNDQENSITEMKKGVEDDNADPSPIISPHQPQSIVFPKLTIKSTSFSRPVIPQLCLINPISPILIKIIADKLTNSLKNNTNDINNPSLNLESFQEINFSIPKESHLITNLNRNSTHSHNGITPPLFVNQSSNISSQSDLSNQSTYSNQSINSNHSTNSRADTAPQHDSSTNTNLHDGLEAHDLLAHHFHQSFIYQSIGYNLLFLTQLVQTCLLIIASNSICNDVIGVNYDTNNNVGNNEHQSQNTLSPLKPLVTFLSSSPLLTITDVSSSYSKILHQLRQRVLDNNHNKNNNNQIQTNQALNTTKYVIQITLSLKDLIGCFIPTHGIDGDKDGVININRQKLINKINDTMDHLDLQVKLNHHYTFHQYHPTSQSSYHDKDINYNTGFERSSQTLTCSTPAQMIVVTNLLPLLPSSLLSSSSNSSYQHPSSQKSSSYVNIVSIPTGNNENIATSNQNLTTSNQNLTTSTLNQNPNTNQHLPTSNEYLIPAPLPFALYNLLRIDDGDDNDGTKEPPDQDDKNSLNENTNEVIRQHQLKSDTNDILDQFTISTESFLLIQTLTQSIMDKNTA